MPRLQSATLTTMARSAPAERPAARVLPFPGGDEALIAGICEGQRNAAAALVDRYGTHIERVLWRVLGPDQELPDILNDVIAHALANVHQVRRGASLKSWLTQLAVFSARGVIRRRRRRSWLTFFGPSDVPEMLAPPVSPETHDVLVATYAILEQLPDEERIAFSLRFVGEMELTDVAAALGVSLATVKRILRRAESRFLTFAQRYPAVLDAIGNGSRWGAEEP